MLESGQITSAILSQNSDMLLRELFGDLLEEKTTEANKKHIKESKAKKAMPVFEIFS